MNNFKLEDLLFEELILTDMEAVSYEDLIKQIGDIAYEKGYVEKDFYKGVIEREKLYPTGLPTNILKVAIPHAMERDHVIRSSIIVSKLKKPVPFREMGSISDNMLPVDLVFLLAVNGTKDQLGILQDLVGMFSDTDAMTMLDEAKTPKEMMIALNKILS